MRAWIRRHVPASAAGNAAPAPTRLDSPPRLTSPLSRRHHRAGPLRRQARQGCQGPPLGRRRRRDGARNHEREAEAQVREEEHHRQARGGGRRRLVPRQSGTSSAHIDARGDRPRPSSVENAPRRLRLARSRRDPDPRRRFRTPIGARHRRVKPSIRQGFGGSFSSRFFFLAVAFFRARIVPTLRADWSVSNRVDR